jgi:hypothetical protein
VKALRTEKGKPVERRGRKVKDLRFRRQATGDRREQTNSLRLTPHACKLGYGRLATEAAFLFVCGSKRQPPGNGSGAKPQAYVSDVRCQS